MKKKIAAILIPVLLIAVIVAIALSRKAKPSYTDAGMQISNSGFYFDTVITVTLYDETDDSLIDGCFDLCDRYEKMLSRTVEGSDIWNVNHAKGKETEVDPKTAYLLNEALSYCELTGGRFDVSIAAASSLWDFGEHDNPLPDPDDLKKALDHIDYRKVHVDEESCTVRLDDPEMMIDLGGIAKGFIADELAAYLRDNDVQRALINLGGNVMVLGSKPDGTPFKVGIQYPFKDEGEIIAAAEVSGCSLVTSGPYERYIEKDGRIYHHILDVRTGYAVENNLISVSVCAPSSLQADALSTSVFVLGLEKGSELIKSLDGVTALIITDDGEMHTVGDFPIIE